MKKVISMMKRWNSRNASEHDYFKAIELAKKENKPVLIDFTGYGCENCRKNGRICLE